MPETATPTQELLTRREAAEYLRISLDGLDAYVHHATDPLPMYRMGRRFLFRREDLLRYCRRAAERTLRGRTSTGRPRRR